MTLATVTGGAALDRVLAGASLLDSLHAGAQVRALAAEARGDGADRLLAAFESGDELARVLLLPALAALPDGGEQLVTTLLDGSATEREHAAWALGDHPPLLEAVAPLEAQ